MIVIKEGINIEGIIANYCNYYRNKEVEIIGFKKWGLGITDLNGKGGWFKCQPLNEV